MSGSAPLAGKTGKERPLRLAFERACIFRPLVQRALDGAGIPWELAVESDQIRPIEAAVSADLAVHTQIESSIPSYFEVIRHGGALPDLPPIRVNLHLADGPKRSMAGRLAEYVREAYSRTAGSSVRAAE